MATRICTNKQCEFAGIPQSLANFGRQARYPDGVARTCKKCRVRLQRKRYKENFSKDPLYFRKRNLWALYRITLDEYMDRYNSQNGICLICKKPSSDLDVSGNPRDLCVDHIAGTMIIRGLLCSKCNSAIGLLGHDIDNFKRAIEYIEQNNRNS